MGGALLLKAHLVVLPVLKPEGYGESREVSVKEVNQKRLKEIFLLVERDEC